MTDAYTGLEQSRAGIGRPQFSPAGSAEPPSIRVDIGARDDRDACPVGPRRAGTSDPTGGLSDPTFLAATGATDAGIDVSASDRGAQIFRVRLRAARWTRARWHNCRRVATPSWSSVRQFWSWISPE
jgi:hypothetical protein